MTAPNITIVMPAYNAAPFIQDAIESILQQTYHQFEFIIINDGSNDDTANIISRFSDERIRFVNNTSNIGLVAVRNLAVSLATGKYIALMDADDIAYPDRLEKQVKFLENHPSISMVGSSIDMIDDKGRMLKNIKYPAPCNKIPSLLLFGNYFAQSSIMIRRKCLISEPYRNFPGVEDYDLWIRMADYGETYNLQKTLVKYRVHKAGISLRKQTDIEKYLRIIIAENLRRLGVIPTQEELDIHRAIDNYGKATTLEFIQKTEQWLLKLLDHNDSKHIYNAAYFRIVIGEKWFYSCLSARKSGLTVWNFFGKSLLRKFYRLKCYQYVGFFTYCLIYQFLKLIMMHRNSSNA